MGSSRTPWKKSRTYGDIYGGRQRRRMTDNIFTRLHSLPHPSSGEDLPIVLADNPSRDFRFPTTGERLVERLGQMPADDTEGITHLWLRRRGPGQEVEGLFADYITGSGVGLIVIYPWPRDPLLRLGSTRPKAKTLKSYAAWTDDLVTAQGQWCLRWTPEAIEAFTLDSVVPLMVGYHVAWRQRRWAGWGNRADDARARSYAARWSLEGFEETVREG